LQSNNQYDDRFTRQHSWRCGLLRLKLRLRWASAAHCASTPARLSAPSASIQLLLRLRGASAVHSFKSLTRTTNLQCIPQNVSEGAGATSLTCRAANSLTFLLALKKSYPLNSSRKGGHTWAQCDLSTLFRHNAAQIKRTIDIRSPPRDKFNRSIKFIIETALIRAPLLNKTKKKYGKKSHAL
jgi:hypothetical protein